MHPILADLQSCILNAKEPIIEKIDHNHKSDICGFWHIYAVNNYMEIISEQLNLMKESELFYNCKQIQVVVVGMQDDINKVIDMFSQYTNIKIMMTSLNKDVYEFPILSLIKKLSYLMEGYYFYIHTKGVSTKNKYAKHWRDYMNHFILTKWMDNVIKLKNGYETCGVKWATAKRFWRAHYSGNFWWCRSKYLQRCPEPETLDTKDRYQGEWWIGMGNPVWSSLSQLYIDDRLETQNVSFR